MRKYPVWKKIIVIFERFSVLVLAVSRILLVERKKCQAVFFLRASK